MSTVDYSLFKSGDPIDNLYTWEDDGGAIPVEAVAWDILAESGPHQRMRAARAQRIRDSRRCELQQGARHECEL
jgi:hypothetical protein